MCICLTLPPGVLICKTVAQPRRTRQRTTSSTERQRTQWHLLDRTDIRASQSMDTHNPIRRVQQQRAANEDPLSKRHQHQAMWDNTHTRNQDTPGARHLNERPQKSKSLHPCPRAHTTCPRTHHTTEWPKHLQTTPPAYNPQDTPPAQFGGGKGGGWY